MYMSLVRINVVAIKALVLVDKSCLNNIKNRKQLLKHYVV
jgi:hypothetical protein